jgi:hypothetical protein
MPLEEEGLKSRSYIYREVLRDCFKSYNLHIKSNTLVDLRQCPLASGLTPKVSLVFVQECIMRKVETKIGKVNSQTKIIIDGFHEMNFYSRISQCLSSHSSHEADLLHGLELPYEILENSIKRQQNLVNNAEVSLSLYSGIFFC